MKTHRQNSGQPDLLALSVELFDPITFGEAPADRRQQTDRVAAVAGGGFTLLRTRIGTITSRKIRFSPHGSSLRRKIQNHGRRKKTPRGKGRYTDSYGPRQVAAVKRLRGPSSHGPHQIGKYLLCMTWPSTSKPHPVSGRSLIFWMANFQTSVRAGQRRHIAAGEVMRINLGSDGKHRCRAEAGKWATRAGGSARRVQQPPNPRPTNGDRESANAPNATATATDPISAFWRRDAEFHVINAAETVASMASPIWLGEPKNHGNGPSRNVLAPTRRHAAPR